MGPLRKTRCVNKRYSDMVEVSPVKDVDKGKSSGNNRKRKLSDMLGPQWNKEELTRFYDAFRKHGKDWKKVANFVKHRSVDMVEALYKLNRAYLSLPEGTASVVGLIAMMTDHYSNMAGSDTEQESDDGIGTSIKPQKRPRVKPSKGFEEQFVFHSPTSASGYSYPTLTKKQRTGGVEFKKKRRTPRYPVTRVNENVKGASQRGGSPQGSQTPNRRMDVGMPSAARNAKFKLTEVKMNTAKLVASDGDDDDDLEGSMEADTGELPRHRTLKKQSGQVGKGIPKRRKTEGKKADVNDDNHFEDIREACSGTEEGQRLKVGRKTHDAHGNIHRASPKGSKRRSKKILFERDEPEDNSAFDALNTLAALSTMMEDREIDNESFAQLKDEEDDHVDESGYSEAMPHTQNMREKRRSPGLGLKGDNSKPREGVFMSKVPKSGKASIVDDNIVSEAHHEGHHNKSTRKKPKNLPKDFMPDARVTGHLTESQDFEAKDHEKISKNKRPSQLNLIKKMKNPEMSYPRIEGIDSVQTTSQIPPANDSVLPAKLKDRRKRMMEPKKSQLQSDPHDPAFTVKEKLANCLSNKTFRGWCKFEWFYSAIDYPWYAKQDFVEYLEHVGLGHVPRLTRVEWGVIRSSLGKARRFSQQFLMEEKNKLKQYRESVRKHYADLREGAQEGLPTDLARPLSVGQRVIAIHPKTREIHDGSVLTVDQSRCRVQFDRPELGVEFVKDIDCMPLNPLENIPQLNARNATVDKLYENFNELRILEQSKECVKPPCDEIENLNVSHLPKSTYSGPNFQMPKAASENANQQNGNTPNEVSLGHHTDYPQSLSAPIPAKEADVQAIAELTRALDKKEAVVLELRRMNDDVLDNSSLKESESFQKQYANVLVLLQEANEQVSASLFRLRERNTYPGWPRSIPNLAVDPGGAMNAFENSPCPPYEAGSHVKEIIETSRSKARTMVNVAEKAVSSLQRRENMFDKIEEAIDFVNEQLSDDSIQPTSETPDKDGPQIPSELISNSVATVIMIQKCTERQFPPADVAQILNSALASLKPQCPQNVSVYSEIQKCMGMLKNQILALIPT